MLAFDSLNPYDAMGVLIADTPQDLVDALRNIRTPIKIHFIVPFGNRQAAYYTGDTAVKKVKSNVTTLTTDGPRVSKIR